jgi:hypothetical protein
MIMTNPSDVSLLHIMSVWERRRELSISPWRRAADERVHLLGREERAGRRVRRGAFGDAREN